ncbi:hypothetical protein E2C01_029105 [Portunus trituberculatus]|uniref:Uncharacterized protein n=1 Tax=Portunus trituberculatus TaxID=210409 RepID=A0A5B7ER38_PORTR|nr:hypothetical protein [Portunus trituberculatus]
MCIIKSRGGNKSTFQSHRNASPPGSSHPLLPLAGTSALQFLIGHWLQNLSSHWSLRILGHGTEKEYKTLLRDFSSPQPT